MPKHLLAGDRDGTCMEPSRIEIHYELIESLKPDPENERQHSKRQLRQIARSLDTFGFIIPVAIDPQKNIVCGHARVEAAKLLGISEVPTVPIGHLSPEKLRAFRLADNKLALNATWDERLLGEHLRELSELNLELLDVTGFEIGEIDLMIENAAPQADKDDEVPAAPPGPQVSKPGDLWKLGPHRIICGNALEESAYQVLMGDECAAAVFTDPPYNVPIDGHASGLGAIHHREFAMASGEMDEKTFTGFLSQSLGLLARHSLDGSLHYVCMDWRHVRELLDAAQPVYSALQNWVVWTKNCAGMGSLYRSQHEFVLVFKNGRAPHRNNVKLGKHGRNRSNVWDYPCARSFSRASDEGNLLALHPTVKPVRLVADALLDSTARGNIVLDAFLGSGTTLIAAERVRRRCYALEIDPLYVDTAIRRWQAYTGEAAHHATTSRSFDETAASTLGDAK
jgi:DNA modification methylase